MSSLYLYPVSKLDQYDRDELIRELQLVAEMIIDNPRAAHTSDIINGGLTALEVYKTAEVDPADIIEWSLPLDEEDEWLEEAINLLLQNGEENLNADIELFQSGSQNHNPSSILANMARLATRCSVLYAMLGE
jgi:hypothetical protein